MTDVPWSQVRSTVAGELRSHRGAGLDRLLTEDVVRFSTVRALVAAGVQPSRLVPEWRARANGRTAVDLVVDDPPTVAIEFKYPREPVETNAAWTPHLGEMLKDLYRLAALPSPARKRWAVQVVSARLRRYLDRRADEYGVQVVADPGRRIEVSAEQVIALPATARTSVEPLIAAVPTLRALCVERHDLGADLTLNVLDVERSDEPR